MKSNFLQRLSNDNNNNDEILFVWLGTNDDDDDEIQFCCFLLKYSFRWNFVEWMNTKKTKVEKNQYWEYHWTIDDDI